MSVRVTARKVRLLIIAAIRAQTLRDDQICGRSGGIAVNVMRVGVSDGQFAMRVVMHQRIRRSEVQAIAHRQDGDDSQQQHVSDGAAHSSLNSRLRLASILSRQLTAHDTIRTRRCEAKPAAACSPIRQVTLQP